MNLDTHSQTATPRPAGDIAVSDSLGVFRPSAVGEVPVIVRKRRRVSLSTEGGTHPDTVDIPKQPRVFVVAAVDANPSDSQGLVAREQPPGPGTASEWVALPRRRRVRSDRRPGEVTHVVFPSLEAPREEAEAVDTTPFGLAFPEPPSPYAQIMAALSELRELVRMAEHASKLRFV